jgi:DNA-binding NarL/FixJ family response regulator
MSDKKLKNLNILIVDDHPFIIDLYIKIINMNNGGEYEFNFITAMSSEEAIRKINFQKTENKKINVALLDISIPSFGEVKSGVDLILILKEHYLNCKIVIVTAFTEPLKIYNLIQKINIEVILCKSDIDFTNLSELFVSVNYEEKYMSKTVKKEISLLTKKKMNLDNLDLEIIEKMSQGIKTIDLPNFIPLSLSTIEKRKARLKIEFMGEKGSDKMLLEKVKKMGLL